MVSLLRVLVKRLFALFWVSFVVLVIIGAISLTTARVMFSNAEEYRDQVASWLSERLQQPVKVKALDAEMQGLQPTLLFKNVRLLDPQGKQTLLQFREFRVGIDLWNSLWQRKIMLGLFTVVGADLSIKRSQQGVISVKGLVLTGAANQEAPANPTAAGNWIFSQPHLVIRDSTVYWLDQGRDEQILRFDIAKIELRNQGKRHQLEGVATLPSGLGETMRIAADFTGSGEVLHDWEGEFYLNGLGIKLAPLLEQARLKQVASGTGQLDMELWGQWKNGRLTRLQGESGVRDLKLVPGTGGKPYQLDLANGKFYWRQDDKGWELDVSRLRIVRGESWPDARLRLALSGAGQASPLYEAQLSFLRLGDIADLLPFGDMLPAELRKAVRVMRPQGELSDLQVDYRPKAPSSQRFSVSGRIDELQLKPWKKLPGMEGLSGILWADADSGAIRLESSQGQVDFPHLARNPWRFKQLNGTVSWQKNAGSWYFSSQDLLLDNEDLQAKAELDLVVPGAGVPPFLDLQVAFKNGDVSHASRYYPVAIMPKNLVKWLDRSLIDGEVTGGKLILHGRLKKGLFPYRKGQGVFEVAFKTRRVRLDYLKNWPGVRSLAAEVVFRGQGMTIDARKGQIMGVRIDGTHVSIADYRDKMLTVLGEAKGKAAQMLHFLQKIPVAAGAGPALKRMSVTGQATLGLYVGVPFSHHPVDYRGTVTLAENGFQYQLGAGYLEATNINGRVQFDREGYRADALEAFIFDRPARVDVITRSEGEQVTTRLAIDGRVLPSPLARQLHLPLLERLDGESEFRAELDLNYRHTQPGLTLGLRLDSSLQGITSRLPAPLDKIDKSARPLHIDWDDISDRIRFSYGNRLNGVVGLKTTDRGSQLERGHIHFGSERVRLPAASVLRVTGRLENFPARQWVRLLPDGSSTVEKRALAGLRVELDLERLHLVSATDEQQGGKRIQHRFDPRFLPELTVAIQRLKYQQLDLGQLTFKAKAGGQGMAIRQLVLAAPYMKLQGTADWLAAGEQEVRADLTLSAPRTDEMLRALGLSAMLRGKDLSAEGRLDWPGSPMDFDLRTLRGSVKLDIGAGQIESVEPGAGRLFGLFSLQALPRRLMLDFRDLFGKGFRFDRIKGEIHLDRGNATTHDLLLEGPTARIAVSGRTGYVAKDYDQHILVIPGDGSNLFVAGALAWGPQAGALIWMAEKLLRLDKVAQYVYHVTGSWENPVIVRGREKSSNAPPEVE